MKPHERSEKESLLQYLLPPPSESAFVAACTFLWKARSSRLWAFKPVLELLSLPGVFKIHWDSCRYDEVYKKPITLVSNFYALARLQRFCQGGHRHEPLQGRKKLLVDGGWRWVSNSTQSGEYSLSLCRRWASLVQSAAPSDLVGPTPPWVRAWENDHLCWSGIKAISRSAAALVEECNAYHTKGAFDCLEP